MASTASSLTSLGRPEWIARSPEEYSAIALRAELQASPLTDNAGFTPRELLEASIQNKTPQ